MPYLGKTPSQATRQRYYKTASAGDTSVSGTMTTGGTLTFTDGEFVDVSVNGVALVAGTDYNTSTANTIAGLSALSAGDQVEIVVYDTFSVFSGDVDSNMNVGGNLSVTGTATLTGNADFNGDLDVDGTTNLDVVDIDGAVDMASTLQVDGAITSSAGATITTADNATQLTLKSTDADANSGPVLDLIRDSSSPAADDGLGRIRFKGDDAGGNEHNYAQIQAKIVDATDGSEGSEMQFYISRNGSVTSGFTLHESEAVFNDGSLDADFRVESNGDANLLKVDAGNDVLGIGAASPDTTFRTSIHGDGSSIIGGILFRNASGGGNTFTIGHASATSTSGKINVVGAGNLVFATNNTEAARFDSSGNFLVGKTSLGTANDGLQVKPAGELTVTRDGNHTIILNRKSSDGDIALFQKDGTTVGAIGNNSGQSYFFTANDAGCGIAYGSDNAFPSDGSGALSDNSKDLGGGATRWDDVFATNGTIQTSDENEKQNIAALTSAEITAAKAISKLFKTFKWKDKVVAKGDAARTHTGVVAQQVQKAMSDAGLDATKYAFWCSDTWTNDDGNQQTRMGVRYPELLAFIGAATEQRLADIETRLTALENAQ